MNFYNKTITSTILILVALITSCSSDDDQNFNLLLGDWIETGKCEEQNVLKFNSNKSYIWIQSQNSTCESNMYPTTKTTGTYTVSGQNLVLNRENTETIDPGEIIPDTVLQHYISSRILTLTENSLEIEITYRNDEPSLPGVKVNFNFYR